MKRRYHMLAGLAVGAMLVWLLFRNTDWGELGAAAARASLPWLLASTGLMTLSSFARAKRWAYIVRTAKPVRFRHVFAATQIGLVAGSLLPARLGDLVQASALSRLARLPIGKSIAMTALDRVFDLVSLLVLVAISLVAFTPMDRTIPEETFGWEISFSAGQMRNAEYAVGLVAAAAVVLLVLLHVKQTVLLDLVERGVGRFSRRIAARVEGLLKDFVEGLRVLGNAAALGQSLACSLLTWGLCVLAFAALLQAFDISGPWYASLVIVLFLALAISLPGPPGLIGQFQAPIVLGLVLLTPAGDAQAKALAITAHAVNLIPNLLLALICIYIERVRMTDLKDDTVMAMKQRDV